MTYERFWIFLVPNPPQEHFIFVLSLILKHSELKFFGMIKENGTFIIVEIFAYTVYIFLGPSKILSSSVNGRINFSPNFARKIILWTKSFGKQELNIIVTIS